MPDAPSGKGERRPSGDGGPQAAAVWSWALYDCANSAFATTVMAGFFPVFFKAYWSDPSRPAQSTFALGMANSAASLCVALLAPFLGSVADRGSCRKRFLASFAFVGAAMTGGLWFVGRGQWHAAVGLYVLASVGFLGANIFYDSLLPAVAAEGELDRVSSLGFSLGYVAGGLLFAANVLLFKNPGLLGLTDGAAAIRLSFLSVAVWWAALTVPLLWGVREPRFYEPVPLREAVILGWRQLVGTIHEVKKLRSVGLFLLAYWLYIDGVDTIVVMAVDYGMGLGFPDHALITSLLLVQVVAFPAALAYGRLAGVIGAKSAILTAIAAYGGITLLAYFMTQLWEFYALAALVGLFQGGIQALSRSLYAQIIPPERSGQFFGFYNMLGKFAAVLGPALMGIVTRVTGTPRLGILSLMALFAAGAVLLSRLDVEAARRAARGPAPPLRGGAGA